MEGVGSESEGEEEGDFKGTVSAIDRRALRLCTPIKTQHDSVFACINRVLKLTEVTTGCAENDMKVDGRIDGKDDEDTPDGKAGAGGHSLMSTTHIHFLLFLYSFFYFSKSCDFFVFAVLPGARL